MRQDALHELVAGERVHQRRRGAGGEDVEVAAGLAAAAQAADRRDVGVGRVLAERGDERGGRLVRFGHQPAAGRARPLLERLQDEGLLLRAHALEAAQPSLARRALEVVERADAELAVEQRDGLRADALQAEQVEDGRRELLQQLLVIGDRAGVDELADLGVEVLADPGDREPCRGRQVGDPLGGVRDGLRGVAVRADLERVLALDLEQVADLGEHARDGEVVEAHSR